MLSHTKGQSARPREVYFWKIIKLIYQPYFYPKLIFFPELIGQLALFGAPARKRKAGAVHRNPSEMRGMAQGRSQ